MRTNFNEKRKKNHNRINTSKMADQEHEGLEKLDQINVNIKL